MKILIIEDEHLAQERAKKMIKDIIPEAEFVGCLSSVKEGKEFFETTEEPDLLIMDIHLSDGLCFDIFLEKKISCPVIFTTAYDQYAIKAFEMNALDYLLKPFPKDKLEVAIEKAKTQGAKTPEASQDLADTLSQITEMLNQKQKQFRSRYLIKAGNRIKSVNVANIAYFFSEDKMTYLVTNDQAKLPMDQTLEEISSQIDPKQFFRINRKFICHVEAIAEIHPYFKGRLVLKLNPPTEEKIVISSEKTPVFKAWIDQ